MLAVRRQLGKHEKYDDVRAVIEVLVKLAVRLSTDSMKIKMPKNLLEREEIEPHMMVRKKKEGRRRTREL